MLSFKLCVSEGSAGLPVLSTGSSTIGVPSSGNDEELPSLSKFYLLLVILVVLALVVGAVTRTSCARVRKRDYRRLDLEK